MQPKAKCDSFPQTPLLVMDRSLDYRAGASDKLTGRQCLWEPKHQIQLKVNKA